MRKCELCGSKYDPDDILGELEAVYDDPTEDFSVSEIYKYADSDEFVGMCAGCIAERIGTDCHAGQAWIDGD